MSPPFVILRMFRVGFRRRRRDGGRGGIWEAGVDGYAVYAITVGIYCDGYVPTETMIGVIVVDDECGAAGQGGLRNV